MDKVRHLSGMRDLSEEAWLPLRRAQDRLRDFLSSYGYRVLETPFLEPTELFLRKSGGELATRIYSFTDPGSNQVSLRPEYTASILRHYLEQGTAAQASARVQYAGPVFRYEENSRGYRQFTQVGAELLGSTTARADAEVLSLSCAALGALGLQGIRLEIGDLNVLYRILEGLGLSERATAFMFASLGDLRSGKDGRKRVEERANLLGMLGTGRHSRFSGSAIGEMDEEEALDLLHGLVQWADAGSLGQREPAEVVEGLLRKFRGADDPAQFRRGLDAVAGLAVLKGDPATCLEEARHVLVSQAVDASGLDRLSETMDLLSSDLPGGTEVVLDLGLARGLAYYTGIVFELKTTTVEASIGGGGRYDGLAKALGSSGKIPALGFAYTLEHLVESAGGPDDAHLNADSVFVVPGSADAYAQALSVTINLRNGGIHAELDVWGMDLNRALSYARSNGTKQVIMVDSIGGRTTYEVEAPCEGGSGNG